MSYYAPPSPGHATQSYYAPPSPGAGAQSYYASGPQELQSPTARPSSYYSQHAADSPSYGGRHQQPSSSPAAGFPLPAAHAPPTGASALFGGLANLVMGAVAGGGPPAAFARPPPAHTPCPPFAPMSMQGAGKDLQSGFPLAPPPYRGTPHPFATHDVMQEDWIAFLKALKDEAQMGIGAGALPMLIGPAGFIVNGVKKHRKGGEVGLVVDLWNLHFFEQRRMLVVFTHGLERLSGRDRPPPPAFEEEARRLVAGLPPLQPVGTCRGPAADYYAEEGLSDDDSEAPGRASDPSRDGRGRTPDPAQQQAYGQQPYGQQPYGQQVGGPLQQQAPYNDARTLTAPPAAAPPSRHSHREEKKEREAAKRARSQERKDEKRARSKERDDARRARREEKKHGHSGDGSQGGKRGKGGKDETWRLFIVSLN